MNEKLLRATYISSARHDLRDGEPAALLDVSPRNDAARHITETLAYHDHTFVQALEGTEVPVNATFEAFRLIVRLS